MLARSFDRMLVRLARTGKAWWGEPLAKNLTHSVRIIDANGLHFEKGRVIEVEMVTYPTLKESATARALKEGTGDRLSDQIRAVAESESIPLAFSEEVERSAIALAPPERPEKGGKRRNLERLPFSIMAARVWAISGFCAWDSASRPWICRLVNPLSALSRSA